MSGERANFVIVVPTNALINEVYARIVDDLKEELWESAVIYQMMNPKKWRSQQQGAVRKR